MWKFYLLKALNQQPYTIRYLNPILTYMFSPHWTLYFRKHTPDTILCWSTYPHDFYNIHFLVRDQTLLSREACVFFYPVFQYFFFPKKKTTLWFWGSFRAIDMFRFRREMSAQLICALWSRKTFLPTKHIFGIMKLTE